MSDNVKEFQKANLIKDIPSQKDGFSGQGHMRSARALSVALEDLSQVDSLIGLEGEWGSGKSTVIKLIETETDLSVEKKGKWHFFCFDLWSHQLEVLKLAFLEEFIAWAAMPERKLLDPIEAEGYQEKLSDKIVTTKIENKRQYKLTTVFFVLLFPLLPIAYTWLSPLTFSNSVEMSTVDTARAIAVLYMISLYVLFFIAFLSDINNSTSNKVKSAFSSAAKVFTKETDHDKLTQYIKESSPTSERFQSFFREILSDAQKEGDRVILVMDNIDRLPKDLLLQFWAETRSIVSNVSHKAELKSSYVTGIIPFDTKCIIDAYKEGDEKKETAAIHSARSIVEKTFDTTVKVSPPLSTDWRGFLNKCLTKAFQHDISEKEKYRIYRLLDVHFKERGIYPTPRAIISYINQIVVLWNQWGEDGIPIAHMALYSLLKQNIETNPEILKNMAAASEDQIRVMGSGDWHKSVVSLFYNVHPDSAYEIVLGQDIERDIVKGNSDAFVELSEKVGFAEALPEVIKKYAGQWARNKAYDLAFAAQNLSMIDRTEDYVREGWAALCDSVFYMSDCEVEDVEHYIGLGKIIENAPRSEAIKISNKLLSWFSNNFPSENLEAPNYEAHLWSEFLNGLCLALATFDGDLSKSFQKSVKLPMGAKFAVCVCAHSNTLNGFDYKNLKLSHKVDELKEAANELAQENPELISEIVNVNPKFLDNTLTQSAANYIIAKLCREKLHLKTSSVFIETLSDLCCISQNAHDLKSSIRGEVNRGTLLYHFIEAHESGDCKTISRIIWLTCEALDAGYVPDYGQVQSHPHFGNLSQKYNEYKEYIHNLDEASDEIEVISNLISKSDGFGKWWSYSENYSVEFITLSFKNYVEKMRFTSLPVRRIINEYASLKGILGSDLSSKFLDKFSGWNSAFKKYFSGEKCLEIDPVFLEDVANTNNKELKNIESLVDGYFNAFVKENWRSLLFEGDKSQINLLLSRISQGNYKPPLANFRPAIFEHIKLTLSGKHTVQHASDKWEVILKGLQKNTRDKLAKDVFIDLKEMTTSVTSVEHFVSVYPDFASTLPLDKNPDVAIEQIITPIISADKPVAQKFISTNRKKILECLKNASENALGLVAEAIENQIGSDAEEESSIWLRKLASEAKIPLQSEGQKTKNPPDEVA